MRRATGLMVVDSTINMMVHDFQVMLNSGRDVMLQDFQTTDIYKATLECLLQAYRFGYYIDTFEDGPYVTFNIAYVDVSDCYPCMKDITLYREIFNNELRKFHADDETLYGFEELYLAD